MQVTLSFTVCPLDETTTPGPLFALSTYLPLSWGWTLIKDLLWETSHHYDNTQADPQLSFFCLLNGES